MEPRGILRNKEPSTERHSAETEFDRQEVIRNTRLNAQLAAENNRGGDIRAEIAKIRGQEEHDTTNSNDRLQWDELNLYKTEQEKAATMKIDEPKTPYEGGFDPEGEYYRDDGDEENVPEEIPELSLGEGEYDSRETHLSSLNGGEVIQCDGYSTSEEDLSEQTSREYPLSAEERHQKFEALRKAHYQNAANPLKHKVQVPDED